MKRRDFFKKAGVATAAGLGGLALLSSCDQGEKKDVSAPAVQKSKKTINVVSTWPRDFPGLGLLLSIIAKSAFIFVARPLVLWTPPTSGDTQINFLFFNFLLIYLANKGVVKRLSTGISKNPWICPACKSTVTTLLAPALVIKFATTFAEIDVLGTTFLSCLA